MDIVLRAAAAFVLIYVLLRVTGRRELSTLVQQGVTQSDMSFTGLVLAVGTFTLLAVGTSWLSFRFKTMRRVLEAAPLVVVEHGKPVEHNMRAERLTVEELAEAARLQQIATLDEVEWAIVEPGGQISIIPRAPRR